MPINVTAPNGASVSFPDGTDANTIDGVMRQHFGGAEPKTPARGRPWEQYGHVAGPWDAWRSDPVVKSSGDWWKGDPVVTPPGKTAKPGGDPWAEFRVGAPAGAAGDPWAEFRIPPLPDGFVLDSQTAAHPPLPEGFVLDQPEQPSVAADVAKSAGIGVVKGGIGLAGAPGDVQSAVQSHNPFDWLAERYKATHPEQAAANLALAAKVGRISDVGEMALPTSQDLQRRVEGATGPLYEPKTVAGEYAQTLGEFAPNALGGGGLGARLLRLVGPAAASETAGQVTKGTAFEPAARVVGALAGGGLGAAKVPASVAPTVEKLKDAARAGYEHPWVAAVEIKPQAVTNLSAQIQNDLTSGKGAGFRPITTPKTFSIVDELNVPAGVASVKIADIDSARQALGNLAREVDAVGRPTQESAAASRAMKGIDGFLGGSKQPDLLAGHASLAVPILENARKNWGAAMRAEDLGVRLTRAERQAAKAGSGANIQNAIKQKVSAVLDVPQRSVGYSAAEKAQAERVVRGSPTENLLRKAGKLGFNDGLTLMAHAAAALPSGGWSIPIGVAGTIARKAAEKMTSNQAAKLEEMLRARSPLAQQAAVPRSVNAAGQTPFRRRLMAAALALPTVNAGNR